MCFLSLFAVMFARGFAHSPWTRMQLYALKGLYIFAELIFQCLHVVHSVACVAGNRTQDPQPEVARDQPQHTPATPTQTPAASPSRGKRGQATTDHQHTTHTHARTPAHAEDTPTPHHPHHHQHRHHKHTKHRQARAPRTRAAPQTHTRRETPHPAPPKQATTTAGAGGPQPGVASVWHSTVGFGQQPRSRRAPEGACCRSRPRTDCD